MRILKVNPDVAISSKELGDILDATPQTINQALRSLEDKGLIVRGMVQDEKTGQMVCHAMEVSNVRKVKEAIELDNETESE